MPRITVKVGNTEPIDATISKATPLGALGTEAIAHIGPVSITGSAKAIRRLGIQLVKAADLADLYDQDRDAYNERERREREQEL